MIKTKTGYAEKIGEWRDGAFPKASGGVARLTVHDDVTNSVWKFTGKRQDAAKAIGDAYVNGGRFSGNKVARLYGTHIEIESVPDDFWVGKGKADDNGEFDEVEPNLAAFPDVVAY